MKVIRIVEVDGTVRQHAEGVNSSGYTLCGLTTDGDEMVETSVEWVQGRITCAHCREIIRHCVRLSDEIC